MRSLPTLAMIAALMMLVTSGFFLSLEASSDEEKGPKLIFFEFRSGGAYHISGLGEWIVSLEPDGTFEIAHDVGGEIEDYGSYILTDAERSRLWELVRNFDLAKVKSSARMGVADEVMYIFVVKKENITRTTNIWINDARGIGEITELVDYIGGLIEKYTGEAPVLR